MNYDDADRGVYLHPYRAKQLNRYDGLIYGRNKTITPTDVDGIIQYGALRCWAFLEIKYGDTKIPGGQKMALERLVDNCEKVGEEAILLLCRHYIDDPSIDVIVADTIVSECYWKGYWHSVKELAAKSGKRPSEYTCKYVLNAYFEGREYANHRVS